VGLLLLLAVALTAAADTLDIRFVGNAGFVISDGTVSLVTDLPYQSGAFGYMTYDLADVRPPGRVVAIITHRHDDHFDPNSFLTTGWEIVGPREVTDHLPADRVIPLGSEVSIGQFTIIPLRTPHSGTEHYSYIIEWRGRRLYLTGDTEDPTQLLATEALDVAFVTPWLLCQVSRGVGTIQSAQIVLHHQQPDRPPRACIPSRSLAQGEGFALTSKAP
jgi:L-ascorbate metabolism protein UlaG (beta-lactamase superfamily)